MANAYYMRRMPDTRTSALQALSAFHRNLWIRCYYHHPHFTREEMHHRKPTLPRPHVC